MAIAARMPMIATTIISSMRVKPRWLPRFRCRLYQNRSIRFSFVVYVPPRLQSRAPAFRGGGVPRGRARWGKEGGGGPESGGGGEERGERSAHRGHRGGRAPAPAADG